MSTWLIRYTNGLKTGTVFILTSAVSVVSGFWNVSQTINSKLNVNYVECMKGTNNSSATSGYISHYTWYVSFLLSSNGICNFNNPPVWPCSIQHNKKSAIWLQLLFQINTLTADWDENRIVCKTIHYCNVLWICLNLTYDSVSNLHYSFNPGNSHLCSCECIVFLDN